MNKHYFETMAGMTIKETMQHLYEVQSRKNNTILVVTEFNGVELNSSMTIDDAYVAVTGLTESQLELKHKKEAELAKEKAIKEKNENKSKIQDILDFKNNEFAITQNQVLIFKKIIPDLNEAVQNSIYHGKEILFSLQIVSLINKTFIDKAVEKTNNENLSGSALNIIFYLVDSMLGVIDENNNVIPSSMFENYYRLRLN